MNILETSRLTFREFRADDAEPLAKIRSDAETMRFYPAPFDRLESNNGFPATWGAIKSTAMACGR